MKEDNAFPRTCVLPSPRYPVCLSPMHFYFGYSHCIEAENTVRWTNTVACGMLRMTNISATWRGTFTENVEMKYGHCTLVMQKGRLLPCAYHMLIAVVDLVYSLVLVHIVLTHYSVQQNAMMRLKSWLYHDHCWVSRLTLDRLSWLSAMGLNMKLCECYVAFFF